MTSSSVPCPASLLAALMGGFLCLGPAALATDEQPANVAPNPSFELDAARLGGWLPLGVETTNGPSRVFITNSIHLDGQRALCVRPGPQGVVAGRSWVAGYNGGEEDTRAAGTNGIRGARTIALRLDPDIRSVSGSVWIHGPATARFVLSLVWTGRRGSAPGGSARRGQDQPGQRRAGWLASVRTCGHAPHPQPPGPALGWKATARNRFTWTRWKC